MKYKDASLPVQERVEDLLARMTLEEKVAQLVQVGVSRENRQQVIERLRQTGLGSRIYGGYNMAGSLAERIAEIEDLNELQRIAVEESRLGIPLIHGWDVIHGFRTIFPIPLAMAASFDPEAVERAYEIAGSEATYDSVHWSFAPMLDIARDPRWGRIIEGFGEDPYLAAKMAAAAVNGFQGKLNDQGYMDTGRILACAKHYIGYGAAEGGRDYNTAEISDNTLRNIYLPPFRAAVEAGVGSVMSAFQDLNGEAASASHYLLTELLKDELGFDGFVVSDYAAVAELIMHRMAENERAAAQLAFNAGVDMEMVTDCYTNHLADLVNSGVISTDRLDNGVRRVLKSKFCLGLFEHPYADPEGIYQQQFTPEHQDEARQMATRSMVLLKNDGLLPMRKETGRIALIGPYVEQRRALLGGWTNAGLLSETPTLLEAMREAYPQAELLTASSGLYDEMLMAAANASVVVLALGESSDRTGEDNCVASLDLPAGQEALLEAVAGLGKPLVVVVFAGRPVALTRVLPSVNALLYAWHPGSLGAAAVADLLLGDASPSGKLPVTFPRTEGQIPIHYNHKSTGRRNRMYRDIPITPLFPFGFGLSYTTFSYQDLEVQPANPRSGEAVHVTVTCVNSGDRPGEEIVQCYIQDCFSSLTRPERELKGFKRVLLQPGESQRIEFTLEADELSYYGPKGIWTLEPGEFKVWVGGDSTATLEGSFVMQAS